MSPWEITKVIVEQATVTITVRNPNTDEERTYETWAGQIADLWKMHWHRTQVPDPSALTGEES